MHLKNSIAAVVVIVAIIFGIKTFFGDAIDFNHNDNLTVAERIAPSGQVRLAGDGATNTAKTKAPTKAATSRSGEEVYTAVCASCHAVGVLNAPKSGNKSDWSQRVKRGIDTLVNTAISGIGAMPPKGTCMDCSDDELKAAIEHMIK